MLETTPESLPVAVNEDVQSILKSARIEPQAYNEEPSFYSGLDQSINETNPNKRRAQASKPQQQDANDFDLSEKLKAMEERKKRIERERLAKEQIENEFTLGANKSTPDILDEIIPKASAQKSRVDEFMNFLGNIEQEFSQVVASNRSTVNESPYRSTTNRIDDSYIGSMQHEEPRAAYSKVKERLMELEIEKEEQAKAYEMVKKLREKERNEASKKVERIKEESHQHADRVRQEMAERLEKQVAMIEDLLADKKKLQGKLEEMTEELKDKHHQQDRAKKVADDRLNVELKKNKEAWMASEKVRREKWEKDKIHEIRAQTVKGLEPEIQRIVERNKDDLRKAQELHQNDLRIKREQVIEEYEVKMQALREKLNQEKEQALDKERERSQNKLHEQYERLETQFSDERQRWKDSVFNENSRVETMLKMENDRLKEEIKTVQSRAMSEIATEQRNCSEKIADSERKHSYELKQMKEKLLIEQEEMKSELLKKA